MNFRKVRFFFCSTSACSREPGRGCQGRRAPRGGRSPRSFPPPGPALGNRPPAALRPSPAVATTAPAEPRGRRSPGPQGRGGAALRGSGAPGPGQPSPAADGARFESPPPPPVPTILAGSPRKRPRLGRKRQMSREGGRGRKPRPPAASARTSALTCLKGAGKRYFGIGACSPP